MTKRLQIALPLFFLTLFVGIPSMTANAQDIPCSIQQIGVMDYVETIYDESNGMATSEANTVLQDEQGYIWIGSYGGLYRYNSNEFQNLSFERENAPKTGIRQLYQDSRGRIWIGTNDSGIFVFENEQFYPITEAPDPLPVTPDVLSVRSIEEGADGTIYIGTTSGLFLVNDQYELRFFHDDRIDMDTIETLMCDANGAIWGTTSGSDMFILKDGRILLYLERDFFDSELAYGLVQTQDGSVYIGNKAGNILRIRLKDDTYSVSSLFIDQYVLGTNETINDIYFDRNGKMWVCTDSCIGYFDGGSVFYRINGLSNSTIITQMYEDYEGNLWFASSRRGILKLSLNKFKHIAYEVGITSQTVNATMYYKNCLYIATDSGLTIMDSHNAKVENDMTRRLDGIRIRNLMKDSKGNLWISAYADYGLICYNADTGEYTSYMRKDGLAHDQVRMSMELSNGDVAAATNGGVSILHNGSVLKSYSSAQGIQNETILCLAEGEDGSLYAGSDGNGIYRIDLNTDEVVNITTDDGLQSGVILRMAADPQVHGLWISNGSEAALLTDDGIQQLQNIDAGVGSIFDFKLTDDHIWLMKSFGIIQITREDYIAGNPKYSVLTRRDGLTSSVTANSWNCLDDDGTLYICTGDGVYSINLTDIHRNTIPPKVSVSSVDVDDVSYYGPQDLSLARDAKRITLRLDLLSFGIESGSLEYYLEGFDTAPIAISNTAATNINYTNLPGGDYVFHLKGFNADGTPSEDLSFKIHKDSSFFERRYLHIWLLMGALLLILSVTAVTLYVMQRRALRRQREYKAMTDQTVRIVSKTIDAKDKYTIGHSQRVAAYAMEIGRRYGLSPEQLEQLHYSGLLHDIGKIGVSDRILNKNGKLTPEEYDVIKRHPAIGGDILKEFTTMPWLQDAARYHHERYDGTGYNEGKKGEEIPLYARIISVADAYDAMNSTRVYRSSLTTEVIYQELEKGKGTQFDPAFAQIMMDMINDGFKTDLE